MNLWRTPRRIGVRNPEYECLDLGIYRRPSRLVPPALAAPVKPKALAVPTNYGIRLDDEQRVAPTRPNSGEADPEKPVSRLNRRAFLIPIQYNELMAKSEVLDRKVGNNFQAARSPTHKVFKGFVHRRTLRGRRHKFNHVNEYEYLRRTVVYPSVRSVTRMGVARNSGVSRRICKERSADGIIWDQNQVILE